MEVKKGQTYRDQVGHALWWGCTNNGNPQPQQFHVIQQNKETGSWYTAKPGGRFNQWEVSGGEQSQAAVFLEEEGVVDSFCISCQWLCSDQRKPLPIPWARTWALPITTCLRNSGLWHGYVHVNNTHPLSTSSSHNFLSTFTISSLPETLIKCVLDFCYQLTCVWTFFLLEKIFLWYSTWSAFIVVFSNRILLSSFIYYH